MAVKRTLRATHPSAALETAYRKKLCKLLDDMQKSVVWWIGAAYRRREMQIAQDAGPARDLSQELQSVMRDWQKKYDEAAGLMGKWFADNNSRHVRNSTRAAFKAAGLDKLFTVKFSYMSRRERDVLQSLIIENVNLIKSIPQQYFTEVQGIVQRSIQNGRDLGYLTEELDQRYRITRRRAAMIARDQTGKATESLSRARMQSLGITKGIWIHTSGGKTYRSTHVAMNGKEFDLSKGMYDSAVKDYVFPASLPNCRCTYKPVIPEAGGASDASHTTQQAQTGTSSHTQQAKAIAQKIATNAGEKDLPLRPAKLAGVRRGVPMDFDKADGGRANPNFTLGGGYKSNCQTCVVAHEARMRGYKVQALANMPGSELEKLSYNTNLAWIDPATGKHPKYIFEQKIYTPTRYKQYLHDTLKVGNRYTMQFEWRGRERYGHIVHVSKETDGTLQLFDPQNGKIYKGRLFDEYLEQIKYYRRRRGAKIETPPKLLRVDNLEFDKSMVDKILTGAKE